MRCYVALIFFFLILKVSAQDTIHFRNGDIKAVKVTEIGISDVKYYGVGNLDGPLHVVYKNEILDIKYSNGTSETFGQEEISNPSSIRFTTIEIRENWRGPNYYYKGDYLTNSMFYVLIDNYPDQTRKLKLQRELFLMRDYGKKKDSYFTGVILCGAAGYVAFNVMLAGSQSYSPALIAIGISGAAGLSLAIISYSYKIKYRDQKLKTIKLYNIQD